MQAAGCKDAHPHDHGFTASPQIPEAINHRADACQCVYDTVSRSGECQLIDFTLTCGAKSSGINGTKPGGHADMEDEVKEKQYAQQFPGLTTNSSPVSLVILSMERHGSWSKGTIAYWAHWVKAARDREFANSEFPTPLSILTRRVRQTLAVALWRTNAVHIAQFYRRVLYGPQRVGRGKAAAVPGPSGGL